MRDAVEIAIRDFLSSDLTGFPAEAYSEDEVDAKSEEVYRHIFMNQVDMLFIVTI
jgi:type I restriction enzyme R subunit